MTTSNQMVPKIRTYMYAHTLIRGGGEGVSDFFLDSVIETKTLALCKNSNCYPTGFVIIRSICNYQIKLPHSRTNSLLLRPKFNASK